jgi:hypothetical protein
MSLIHLVVIFIVIGFLLWVANRFIPMEPRIKSIMNIVVIVAVILWLLNVFGVISSFSSIRIGK